MYAIFVCSFYYALLLLLKLFTIQRKYTPVFFCFLPPTHTHTHSLLLSNSSCFVGVHMTFSLSSFSPLIGIGKFLHFSSIDDASKFEPEVLFLGIDFFTHVDVKTLVGLVFSSVHLADYSLRITHTHTTRAHVHIAVKHSRTSLSRQMCA